MFRKKIIEMFCDKNCDREALRKPFNNYRYTYSTNGKVAIRIKRNTRYDKNDKINMKKIFPTKKELHGRVFRKINSVKLDELESFYSKKQKAEIVIIDGVKFNKKFIEKFLCFENVFISINKYNDFGSAKPAFVKFDGGCGVVCPLLENCSR